MPNPNVVTEAKHAKDRGKPMVILTHKIEALPFDWKVQRTIAYENTPSELSFLREALTENLEAIRERLEAQPRSNFSTTAAQPDPKGIVDGYYRVCRGGLGTEHHNRYCKSCKN